jgi:hypothetical protein
MKLSARKMGNIKALKDSLKKGGGSGSSFIKNVPAEGITVRFLTEPEEWFGYYEYWNDESRTFVPMASGEVLPDGAKPSFRYLANAVDIETDRVIPLKLAKTAANSLIIKYDKFGTMTDRNYELQKHGERLDTTYDVTPDGPSRLNLSKYELLDLEQVLITAREAALGEGEADKPSKPTMDDDDIDTDEDDDDEDEQPRKRQLVATGKSTATAAPPKPTYDTMFPDETIRENYSLAELEWTAKHKPDWLQEIAESWKLDVDDDAKVLIKGILNEQFAQEPDKPDKKDSDDELNPDVLASMKLRDLRVICDDMDIKGYQNMSKEEMLAAIVEASEK